MNIEKLKRILEERILVLDGAMGTMIQRLRLEERDFRGERWKDYDHKLKGCNDILCLTMPEAIKEIHKSYIEAGADIISTNTFNANAISLSDYGLEREKGMIIELNSVAARLAKNAVRETGKNVLVAGSVGPTNKTASMSPDVNDPSKRDITYDDLFRAYQDQVTGLIEGGVDLLLFETVFDTLNLKAGLDAANNVMKRLHVELPIMVSATVSDKAGRTLSGQTIPAFITSITDYDNILSIGLNCSFGPAEIFPFIKEVSDHTKHFVSCHPNAGLPNPLGEYDETPERFASHLKKILDERLVNIIGGCCGTTPDHIAALSSLIRESKPRTAPSIPPALRISGLELVEVYPHDIFVNVGERCNVAGSRKFLRLIKEKNYEEAMRIAAKQVEDGAMLIDLNMDDAMLDAKEEMKHFLRYIASDPDVAKVPLMVDSSDWEVIETALKNIQGKSIVNSISLKEGEEKFIARAKRIKELGAAVIVMAFDEEGQADTYKRKIEVCRRSYDILVKDCNFNPNDIIFDVNIMAIATGIPEHDRYGIDFIKAVKWVKENLPNVRTSGGVSNLSFAFRGKNSLREAMHAVFLYHAISNGLDMAIVNPATSVTYEEIEPDLRSLIEDVVLNRREKASEELATFAASDIKGNDKENKEPARDIAIPAAERLTKAIIKGESLFLKEDLDEAMAQGMSAVEIIENPLMEGMNRVGVLFGEGKMFLPQVVKTARTMKQAVDHLKPMMEEEGNNGGEKAGKIVFATVKGDVHDIGKNICSIVLSCNNFEVIDLGVMVPPETIVETVIKEKPDLVCLSGLITPSLSEMVNVVKALKVAGVTVPVLVGGATTSKLHTALKIAPEYDGVVIHVSDASQNPLVASRLLNPESRAVYISSIREEYRNLTESYYKKPAGILPIDEAREIGRKNRKAVGAPEPAVVLNQPLFPDVDLKEIIPLINWRMFFHAWRITGDYLEGFPYDLCEGCVASWKASLKGENLKKGEEALQLYRDALELLTEFYNKNNFDGKVSLAFYRAETKGDTLIVDERVELPMLRQQNGDSSFRSVADYILPEGKGNDYIGVFAVSAGTEIKESADRLREKGDHYSALIYDSLADRIAEATSEWLHKKVKKEYWKCASIRPAVGYPMMPDQLLIHNLARLLPLKEIGISVTENGAMIPSSSVCGMYLASENENYFMVGEIGEDQLADYAERRGLTKERIKEILRQ